MFDLAVVLKIDAWPFADVLSWIVQVTLTVLFPLGSSFSPWCQNNRNMCMVRIKHTRDQTQTLTHISHICIREFREWLELLCIDITCYQATSGCGCLGNSGFTFKCPVSLCVHVCLSYGNAPLCSGNFKINEKWRRQRVTLKGLFIL